MEVTICIPLDTPERLIELAQQEYSDMWEDEGWDDHRRFFEGQSSEDVDADDPQSVELAEIFLDHDQAVECCGFMEGLFGEGCNTLLEDNGPWAQGMLSQTDFSTYLVSDEEKREWERNSKLWWAAFRKGEALAKTCAENLRPTSGEGGAR